LKKSYLTIITYLQVMIGPSCGRKPMVADAVNVGCKQCMIILHCYTAMNPVWPWMIFQWSAVC